MLSHWAQKCSFSGTASDKKWFLTHLLLSFRFRLKKAWRKSGLAKWMFRIKTTSQSRRQNGVGKKGNLRQRTSIRKAMLHVKCYKNVTYKMRDSITLINHETSSLWKERGWDVSLQIEYLNMKGINEEWRNKPHLQ